MAVPHYAILRFAKYKGPEISGIEAHNERTKEKYASNPDIDPSRTHLNFHLIKPERKYRAESEKQIAEAGCRTRSDSVRVVEALITATPEFFKGKKRSELKEFFNEALEFIKQNQAPETIISAVVHLDEKNPHMHLCFVPITKEGKLSAKTMLGNQKSLSEWQTAYHAHMSARWPELERGESSMITRRKHIPTWLFKLGGRLDKQHDEIVKALSDINAFNAGKKRDRALALLSAWLPDMERFSREIQKQSDYINSLKQRVNQSEQYADHLRDGRYAEELKVQEANRRIFELQRTNQQLERLVKLIPPEVLAELQKSGRDRPRGR